jgi:hypothetical protein
MSFPAAVGATATAIAATNPLDVLMAGVNSNPYFIGIMMLLLNLGGRFLALEISKDQEKFLSHPIIRRFFLFAVLFVATRNVIIAAGLTVIVIFVLGYLFNENSELCLWKSCITPKAPEAKAGTEGFQGLSAEEAMILKRLQDKQTAAASASATQTEESPEKQASVAKAADIYNSSLTQISSASS